LTPETGVSIVAGTRDEDYGPSSFLRTRSTAPEQPPQVMVMLKLYVWSDMVCLREGLLGAKKNKAEAIAEGSSLSE
jgi:hypothetical protein